MSRDVSRRFDAGGSPEARRRFDQIFERHHQDVIRYCVRRLGASDGPDAAAEVFVVAWRRLDQIPDGESAKAWLLGVAYRIVSNEYRGRARRGRLVGRLSHMRGDDSSQVEVVGSIGGVVTVLESLRPLDQEVLRMVAWDELSRSEIAEILGISENAVDQRLFRARARLRDRLSRSDALTVEEMDA